MTTKEKIVKAAREEFVAKGFTDASLRTIAHEAGCTVSNIYRHFAHKDALFVEVVSPLLHEIDKMLMEHNDEHDMELYYANHRAYEERMVSTYLPILRNYRLEWRLLLLQAQGSSLEQAAEGLVQEQIRTGEEYIRLFNLRYHGTRGRFPPLFLRICTQWWLTMLREIVAHGPLPDKEIEEVFRLYTQFTSAGWRSIFGLTE